MPNAWIRRIIALLFALSLFTIAIPAFGATSIISPNPASFVERGKTWTSIPIHYSKSNSHNGYRTDCSGFVSMMWSLPNSGGGPDTTGLLGYAHKINEDQLQVGDILLNTGEDAHVVLFEGWANNDHKAYTGLEENGYYGYAMEHQIPYPYYSGYFPQNYVPMRMNGIPQIAPSSSAGQPVNTKKTPVTSNNAPTPPVPQPAPIPTQPPAQTQNFGPFVGTWYAHAQSLVIKADGSALYTGRVFVWCVDYQGNVLNQPPCDGGGNQGITPNQHAIIQFTKVNGNSVTGTIQPGGTGMRDSNNNNAILPVGSTVTVTLNNDDTVNVSNGENLCGPQAIANQVNQGCISGA